MGVAHTVTLYSQTPRLSYVAKLHNNFAGCHLSEEIHVLKLGGQTTQFQYMTTQFQYIDHPVSIHGKSCAETGWSGYVAKPKQKRKGSQICDGSHVLELC